MTDAAALDSKTLILLDYPRLPIEILAESPKNRRRGKKLITHYCGGCLPQNSVVKIRESCYASSPEFCFLQMARQSSLIQLVQLGLEFCGTYSIRPSCETGFIKREQLLSSLQLNEFLNASSGRTGIKKARRAAKYIVNGSASPRETIVLMLLCLPCSMGGYGLALPELNRRIELDADAARLTDKNHLVCDFFWPDAKLDVEYDSDDYHTGSQRIASDSKRRNVFDYLDIRSITITREQLNNRQEMDRIAILIAKDLEIRLTKSSIASSAERYALRKALLEGSPR